MKRQDNTNDPEYFLKRYLRLMGVRPHQFQECADGIKKLVEAKLSEPEAPTLKEDFAPASLGKYSYLQHIRVATNPDFQKLAQANQWASRKERGLSRNTRIYDFVSEVYADWLAKGMTIDDFQSVDQAGHKQFLEKLVGAKRKPPQELYAFVVGRTKHKPYPRGPEHGNFRHG